MKLNWQIYHGYYEVINGKTIATFYGRSNRGKERLIIDNFKPYFYYSDNYIDRVYASLDEVKKLECNFPYEVPSLRDTKTCTFEADIPFTRRILIDLLEDEPYIKPKIAYFDIETDRRTGKIIACSAFTSDDKIFYSDDAESVLLNKFVEFIKDYDIITSWSEFDLRELNKKINLPKEVLFLDLYVLFKRMWKKPIENYKLETVAKLVDTEKIDIKPKRIEELNKYELKSYNMQDSRILKLLDEKYNIINYYVNLASLSRIEIPDTIYSSIINDIIILQECKKRGLVLKTNDRENITEREETYEGAYCYCEPGLHKNGITTLDFSGLYPSIIIAANISFDTLDQNGEIILPNGVRFTNKFKGAIPSILDRLIKQRNLLKQKYRETKDEKYNIQQLALKSSYINSIYGFLSYPKSRIYNLDLAESITYIGRDLIQNTKQILEEKYGYKICYTDTDSLYAVTKDDLEELSNKIVKNYVKEKYPNFMGEFKIEQEGKWDRIFIKTKKQYVLFKEPDTYVIKGMGIVRGDTSKLQKDIEFFVIKELLNETPKIELASKVSNLTNKIKEMDLNDIAFPRKIYPNKAYKVTTQAQRALDYTKKYIGEVEYEDSIKLVYIRKVPEGYPPTDVIALPLDLSLIDKFEIDYDTIVDKSINRIKPFITLDLNDFFN